MDIELAGTRALVTGGSRGIGRAIVELLLAEGCRVEFCAQSSARVAAAETELAVSGLPVHGTAVDLRDQQATLDWVAGASARLGGIDIVIANASAMATGNEDDSWRQNYLVEISGLRTILSIATGKLIDSAKRRGDAAVVVIGSTAAGHSKKRDAYGATKAALVHTVKGLSHELVQHGIRVNMVSPGPVYSDNGVWEELKIRDPEYVANKIAGIPLGRMGQPIEIANVVLFLCSPRAGYIVGGNVIADGGRSERPAY